MDCREFEALFERWCAGTLEGNEKLACEAHLAACGRCGELAELARLPLPPLPVFRGARAPGLVSAVLERTSGEPCLRLEHKLPVLLEKDAGGSDHALLAEHVANCSRCTGLVSEIERLTADLPRLARIAPEPSLVAEILRSTLPLSVRLRRWWVRTEPRWVRRPRIAAELSYALTLVLVLVFGTPVSPLQAMPQKALEIVRAERAESPKRFDAWRAAAGHKLDSGLRGVRGEITERAESLATAARRGAGTILEEVASWFEDAGKEEDEPAEKE